MLPSLISALNWAGLVFQHDTVVVEKILDVLIKGPGTTESREIHHTILAMCAPSLTKRLRATEDKPIGTDSVLDILDDCEDFTLSSECDVQKEGPGLVGVLQHGLVALIASADSSSHEQHLGLHDIPAVVKPVVEAHGADAALRALIGTLLQLSGTEQFLFALDAITTTICLADDVLHDALRLKYHNLGALLKTGDTLTAEAVVRLYRQVEAYKNLLTVQDMGLDTIFAQQLTNIDTVNPNLDAAIAVSEAADMQVDQSQPDGIDQVLDEVAAMGNLDSNDADMSFDALYGLQGNDMDLNDLDLDMF